MLRRRLNVIESHIYRLHPELLSLVASHLPRESLVKATHVSHRWRATLLSFPTLWTDIHFANPQQMLVFLERSKSTPISILRVPLSPDPNAAYNFLAKHATRIETLVVIGSASSRQVLLPPMPSLRDFEFSGDYTLNDDFPAEWITLPTITTLAVRGGAGFLYNVPRLTKLRVLFKWYLNIDKLHRLLERCPLLEELDVGYDSSVFAPPRPDPVGLPCLRFYSQYTSASTPLRLLDGLNLPPSCSVVFNYWNNSATTDLYDDETPFHNPSPLNDLKRINIRTTNQAGGFVDGAVELIDDNNHRVSLATRFGNRLEDDISDSLYLNFFKGLDASTVELLCIEDPEPWRDDHAKEVLSRLKGIRTLVLSNLVVASFIMALDPESDKHNDKDVDVDWWLCPELEVLVVHVQEFSDFYGEEIMEYLPGIAQRRKDGGIPFKSVSLFILGPWDERAYGPMESQMELEQLRSCVEKLEIVVGDDVLDWSIDDYFFGGLEIRRDRHLFPCQPGSDDPHYCLQPVLCSGRVTDRV